MPEADISGPQRKVVTYSVRPRKAAHGEGGIALRGGRSLPFVVTRSWSAPAGNYQERFYLADPESREILYEGPESIPLIWGLQSETELSTTVSEPLELKPGTYLLVFALGGVAGGEFEVEAAEAPATEAA